MAPDGLLPCSQISQLFFVLMSQMNAIANLILRNVLKPVTTLEISKKRGSSKMLHNVTHSSSVLHFEAKNRKPKTLDLKKSYLSSVYCLFANKCGTVCSCATSLPVHYLPRKHFLFTSLYAFLHVNSSIQFLRVGYMWCEAV
jgi:hypothetical protein